MSEHTFTTLNIKTSGGVAYLTLDNGPINLMDLALINDLDHAGQQLEADPAVKVVVLQSANPDFFIAHADLHAINNLPGEPPARTEKLGWIHGVLDRFRSMPKVTIAKIQGICRGGGSELALACDMRFGEIGRAVLCQPEVGVGIIPGAGGSVRLPRLVGRGRALEIILGCDDFSAEMAERYGYINRALPAGEIDDFVDALARRIASFPGATLAMAKQAASMDEGQVESQLAEEERIFFKSVRSDGAQRRIAAALAGGMQQAEMEKLNIHLMWDGLAAV